MRAMGLINGLYGIDGKGWGWIEMVISDDGVIERFRTRNCGECGGDFYHCRCELARICEVTE